jgi:hypothetical protein
MAYKYSYENKYKAYSDEVEITIDRLIETLKVLETLSTSKSVKNKPSML